MDKNVGTPDRVVRAVVGLSILAIIYFAPWTGTAATVAGVAAAVLLVSALLSRCLIYKLIGIDTSMPELPYHTTDDRAGL